MAEKLGSATYSPEDNKLRLYPFARLSKEDYDRVRAMGFIWAPKQELFVAPMWTPNRADFLEEIVGEIEDEDKTLVERAEERAERFESYSEKRAGDADRAHKAVSSIADNIPFGQPILVGHHSEKHARRDAEKIENGMRRAVKMWETSKYWEQRAQGAISHAKYKELPSVRARRIKGLEADLRKQEKNKKRAEEFIKAYTDQEMHEKVYRDGRPYAVALLQTFEGGLPHEVAWAFEKGEKTMEEVLPLAMQSLRNQVAYAGRWINHITNRLSYEKAMMQESGGLETDKKGPEKGGACVCWASPRGGWAYIQKVNRISVTVEDNWGNGGRNFTRVIPFDKIKAIMSAAEVQAARDCGTLIETSDKCGFFLRGNGNDGEAKRAMQTEKAPGEEKFQALKETLNAGVQTVTAPELFPTPPELANRIIKEAEIQDGHTVLEPSAGTGAILSALFAETTTTPDQVKAVEINSSVCRQFRQRFPTTPIQEADFLSLNGELGDFDRILMNPPFSAEIEHVQHAFDHLKKGGKLVAIMSEGPFFRSDKKAENFRQWFEEIGGTSEKLPRDTFKESGTSVSTRLVTIEK